MQYYLGAFYENGQGVPQDYKEAVKWFRLAAEQGLAAAQYNLGVFYHKGQGVPKDYNEAVTWYNLVAAQGFTQAHHNLGFMYANGLGVIQDYTIAHMWYNVGAANGVELGGTNRDDIAEDMTTAAIEKAQTMARECMSSDYKKCGY